MVVGCRGAILSRLPDPLVDPRSTKRAWSFALGRAAARTHSLGFLGEFHMEEHALWRSIILSVPVSHLGAGRWLHHPRSRGSAAPAHPLWYTQARYLGAVSVADGTSLRTA